MQDVFRAFDIRAEPHVLHRVQRKVLDASHGVLRNTLGERRTERTYEERILPVRFLQAAPFGVRSEVDADSTEVVAA
jgi:hypothetical protein